MNIQIKTYNDIHREELGEIELTCGKSTFFHNRIPHRGYGTYSGTRIYQ